MKKLIAILMICAFALGMVACGGKKNADTPTTTTGNDTPGQTATAPQGENQATEGSVPPESIPDATDPTVESTPDDPNKVDTPVTTPNQGSGDQGDTDIKVEINNGTSDDPVVSTPTDDDPEGSFVIDFDQLLDASGRN